MQDKINTLTQRARIYKQIRAFFDGLNYLEVDTPLLGSSTNTDIHIQSIQACACQRSVYLQTSPEFSMKRLLAEGSGSIYQICHAFRDEEKGSYHHPEFTLLEWYSMGFDYLELMDQLEALIALLVIDTGFQTFRRISYFDCFNEYLKLDLKVASLETCQQTVMQHVSGINAENLSKDDCLDLLISQVVSKQFRGFTFVFDYPASQASLARLKPGNTQLAERFELFYNELELANGFSELTDAEEQRSRFVQDNQQRTELGLDTYPIDEDFLQALERGLPECAGVALGLDRLLMILNKADLIEQVLTVDTL